MTQWGLDTLFNPAKRHMDEEKRRLQSTREEVGDSSDGKRIDLESGRVTVRRVPSADGADEVPARPVDETAAARRARLRRRGAKPVQAQPVQAQPQPVQAHAEQDDAEQDDAEQDDAEQDDAEQAPPVQHEADPLPDSAPASAD
jgi:hypothetical protein